MIAPPLPPSRAELDALLKEARARQLRRRLFGAAGVAVLAAVGLAVYALTSAGNVPTQVGGSSPRSTPPLCRRSQLSVSAIWDGAGGNLFNSFAIANRGGSACSLPLGRPTVLLTRRGMQLKVEERASSGNSSTGKPVHSLAPGRRAIVHLDWFNWCGAQPAFARTTTSVTVRFADGLRVTAPNLLGQPRCISATEPSVLTVSRPLTPGVGER